MSEQGNILRAFSDAVLAPATRPPSARSLLSWIRDPVRLGGLEHRLCQACDPQHCELFHRNRRIGPRDAVASGRLPAMCGCGPRNAWMRR